MRWDSIRRKWYGWCVWVCARARFLSPSFSLPVSLRFFIFHEYVELSRNINTNVCDDRTWSNFYILTLLYRWEGKREKRRERGRKVHAQISIAKKTAKKWWQFFYIYIYTMQWCYVDKEELRASTTLFFFPLFLPLSLSSLLLEQWCIWHMSVSRCALLSLSVFSSSSSLFILRRWNKKKEEEEENESRKELNETLLRWAVRVPMVVDQF